MNGLDKTIQNAAIATPIAKSQQAREVWFYVMSGGALLKIAVMEIARIVGEKEDFHDKMCHSRLVKFI